MEKETNVLKRVVHDKFFIRKPSLLVNKYPKNFLKPDNNQLFSKYRTFRLNSHFKTHNSVNVKIPSSFDAERFYELLRENKIIITKGLIEYVEIDRLNKFGKELKFWDVDIFVYEYVNKDDEIIKSYFKIEIVQNLRVYDKEGNLKLEKLNGYGKGQFIKRWWLHNKSWTARTFERLDVYILPYKEEENAQVK